MRQKNHYMIRHCKVMNANTLMDSIKEILRTSNQKSSLAKKKLFNTKYSLQKRLNIINSANT